jgi:hypothetical protein
MTTRRTTLNRRAHRVLQFEYDGLQYTAGFGFFEDGAVAEDFLSGGKTGSGANAAAHDATTVASLALQHHVPLSTIKKAVERLPAGRAEGALGHALGLLDAEGHASR